ncbi:MAG: folate family ECF transporter S component [Clostridia bacterium]|nr:folate family ECF transporter S component [Clostridia bacterium]
MFKNFKISNLKNIRVLCATALLVALYVALYTLQIPLSPQLRITFTFIPLAVCGWLFGGAAALLTGMLCDVLAFLFFPTGAYFPGFTLTTMLSGLVYGMFLYKKTGKSLFVNIIIAKIIVTVFFNIVLNSLWISILYKKAFWFYLSGRIIKNIAMLPVEILILFGVIELLTHSGVQKMYK